MYGIDEFSCAYVLLFWHGNVLGVMAFLFSLLFGFYFGFLILYIGQVHTWLKCTAMILTDELRFV